MRKIIKKIYTDFKIYEQNCLVKPIIFKYPLSSNQVFSIVANLPSNMVQLEFDHPVKIENLENAVLELLSKHGLLKSTIIIENGRLFWQEHSVPDIIHLPIIDISKFGQKKQKSLLFTLSNNKSVNHFLSHALPIKLVALKVFFLLLKKTSKNPWLYNTLYKLCNFLLSIIKLNNRKELLYKILLIKRNLREFTFILKLDHIIFDATTLEIIKKEILENYSSGIKAPQKEVKNFETYKHYVDQINKGPQNITPEEIIRVLNFNDYLIYSDKVKKHKGWSKRYYELAYYIDLTKQTHLNKEKIWELTFIICNLFYANLFGINKIPIKMLMSSRRYEDSSFFTTVGLCTDYIPMLIEVDHDNYGSLVEQSRLFIEFVSKHNINFMNLFLQNHLYEYWGEIVSLIGIKQLNPPDPMLMFNFGGKIAENNKIVEQFKNEKRNTILKVHRGLKAKNLKRKGGMHFRVFYTSQSLFINIQSLIKLDINNFESICNSIIQHSAFRDN